MLHFPNSLFTFLKALPRKFIPSKYTCYTVCCHWNTRPSGLIAVRSSRWILSVLQVCHRFESLLSGPGHMLITETGPLSRLWNVTRAQYSIVCIKLYNIQFMWSRRENVYCSVPFMNVQLCLGFDRVLPVGEKTHLSLNSVIHNSMSGLYSRLIGSEPVLGGSLHEVTCYFRLGVQLVSIYVKSTIYWGERSESLPSDQRCNFVCLCICMSWTGVKIFWAPPCLQN